MSSRACGRWLLLSCCALGLVGCSEWDDWKRSKIVGIRGPSAGIQWGGDSPYLSAYIDTIDVEAFESVSDERQRRTYDVVATAGITISVKDTLVFNVLAPLSSTVRFRLVSKRRVILREQEQELKLTRTERRYFVTTRFEGLSSAESGKVFYVSASWVYH